MKLKSTLLVLTVAAGFSSTAQTWVADSVEMGASYDRKGYEAGWKRPPNNTFSTGLNLGIRVPNSDGVIDAVETLVDTYLKVREGPDEDFLAAYRRLGQAPFKDALYGQA